MRVGLSEKITNHTLKNILLYPLVWQDVLIFVPRINSATIINQYHNHE